MYDRHEYHLHARRIEPVRQHYAEANAAQKPSVPTWLKLAALVALIGLAGGLTGCGGGGGDANELTPSVATQSRSMSVLVVGDSTMTPYWPGERSTPDYLAEMTGASVTNLSVSGTDACQADLAAIRAARADVVVANYGLNDAYGASGQPRHSLTEYAKCLDAIDAAARDAGSVLVLLAANPTLPSPGWDSARIDSYNQVKRATGGAYYCAQPAIRWTAAELPDGQHPNSRAKPAIASALAECIGRAL